MGGELSATLQALMQHQRSSPTRLNSVSLAGHEFSSLAGLLGRMTLAAAASVRSEPLRYEQLNPHRRCFVPKCAGAYTCPNGAIIGSDR
jgi:hypothetical protein